MSEMKPCAWTARTQSGAFLTLAAERHQVECHPQLYRSDEIIPLYDGNTVATAIAEAVAAERERCAKVCEDKAQTIMQEHGSLPDLETGEVTLGELSQAAFEAFEIAAEAIRSAAK